jgi:SOS-response transcriptional repressor LexA
MRTPSQRQHRALGFIRGYVREHGCTPTMREIGEHIGCRSSHGVFKTLRDLARKGHLKMVRIGRSKHRYVPVDSRGHCACCGQPMPEN